MKSKSDSAGFTIVEILVAIAVGAILVTAFSNVVTSYVHVSQRGRHLNYSNAFAEAKVESLRNNGYNSLNAGTSTITSELPAKLPRSKSATMVVTSPITGIKQVVLSIKYTDQGNTTTHNYVTYVGELGVGQ